MNLDQQRAAIETRFMAQWMIGSPLALRTPVGMPGFTFTPPVGASSVRMSILNGTSMNKSMGSPGSNIVRHAGVLMFQIFTPGGVGTKTANDLADLIEPIFINWRSGGLLARTMDKGAVDETAPFYMLPVSFTFQRDNLNG